MGQSNVWVFDDWIERTPEWVELITWLILMDILGQSARRIGKKRAPTLILTLCAGHWRSIGRSSRPNQINIKHDFCINLLWGLCVYYKLTEWRTWGPSPQCVSDLTWHVMNHNQHLHHHHNQHHLHHHHHQEHGQCQSSVSDSTLQITTHSGSRSGPGPGSGWLNVSPAQTH